MMMENFISKVLWSLVDEGISLITTTSDAQKRSMDDVKVKDLKVKNFLF